MKAHRADFPIRAMCRVLELSSSGYYDWLKRRPSARAIEDERLGAKIREIWVDSRKTTQFRCALLRKDGKINAVAGCRARHPITAGADPARQLLFRLVAIGAGHGSKELV